MLFVANLVKLKISNRRIPLDLVFCQAHSALIRKSWFRQSSVAQTVSLCHLTPQKNKTISYTKTPPSQKPNPENPIIPITMVQITLKIREIRDSDILLKNIPKHTGNIHETYCSHSPNTFHPPQSISYNNAQ